jgi:hypothetical protein
MIQMVQAKSRPERGKPAVYEGISMWAKGVILKLALSGTQIKISRGKKVA